MNSLPSYFHFYGYQTNHKFIFIYWPFFCVDKSWNIQHKHVKLFYYKVIYGFTLDFIFNCGVVYLKCIIKIFHLTPNLYLTSNFKYIAYNYIYLVILSWYLVSLVDHMFSLILCLHHWNSTKFLELSLIT